MSDILKQSVYDDRIVQNQPRYAVDKGALAVTNSPFNAIAASPSQHTYNILVPSENVFIDRAVDWSSTAFCAATFTVSAGSGYANDAYVPLPTWGQGNLGLCAFPLQSCCTTLTATINDTTVTLNASDVLPQVLRMTDMRKNRQVRTCPTQLDKYAYYSDAAQSINSPLQGFNEAMNTDEVPNGAFQSVYWTQPDGTPLAAIAGGGSTTSGAGSYTNSGTGGGSVYFNQTGAPVGVPCVKADGTGAIAAGTYNVYFAFRSTEKLVLSPFVFSDIHEWDTGLFGCQNIQLVMNLQAPNRVARNAPKALSGGTTNSVATLTPGSCVFNPQPSQGAFQNSVVNIQFLTPSLDVPLPPKSVVPYMEFPRYISGNLGTIQPNTSNNLIQSQTITLPAIPDLLMVYVRPCDTTSGLPYATSQGGSPQVGDWMMPIQGISVNFDNFAGLLSSHTQQQLYKMSVHNGLELDFAQWNGLAYAAQGSAAASTSSAYANAPQGLTPLVGSLLVLKPGRDIALQAGQAPGLVGNFVLQFQLRVNNFTNTAWNPQIVVITANSGFFETIKGSSRIVKGVLTEQDIISSPMAPGGTTGALKRAVGGSIFASLGNALSRVKGMYDTAKPYASAIKGCLESTAKHTGNKTAKSVADALGAVGMGRRSLAERLM